MAATASTMGASVKSNEELKGQRDSTVIQTSLTAASTELQVPGWQILRTGGQSLEEAESIRFENNYRKLEEWDPTLVRSIQIHEIITNLSGSAGPFRTPIIIIEFNNRYNSHHKTASGFIMDLCNSFSGCYPGEVAIGDGSCLVLYPMNHHPDIYKDIFNELMTKYKLPSAIVEFIKKRWPGKKQSADEQKFYQELSALTAGTFGGCVYSLMGQAVKLDSEQMKSSLVVADAEDWQKSKAIASGRLSKRADASLLLGRRFRQDDLDGVNGKYYARQVFNHIPIDCWDQMLAQKHIKGWSAQISESNRSTGAFVVFTNEDNNGYISRISIYPKRDRSPAGVGVEFNPDRVGNAHELVVKLCQQFSGCSPAIDSLMIPTELHVREAYIGILGELTKKYGLPDDIRAVNIRGYIDNHCVPRKQTAEEEKFYKELASIRNELSVCSQVLKSSPSKAFPNLLAQAKKLDAARELEWSDAESDCRHGDALFLLGLMWMEMYHTYMNTALRNDHALERAYEAFAYIIYDRFYYTAAQRYREIMTSDDSPFPARIVVESNVITSVDKQKQINPLLKPKPNTVDNSDRKLAVDSKSDSDQSLLTNSLLTLTTSTATGPTMMFSTMPQMESATAAASTSVVAGPNNSNADPSLTSSAATVSASRLRLSSSDAD